MSEIIKSLSGSNIRISNYYTDKNIYTNIYLVSPNTDDSYTTKPPLISLPNLDDKKKQNVQHTTLLNMSFHLLKTWEPFYKIDASNNNIEYKSKDISDNIWGSLTERIKNTTNLLTYNKTLFDKNTTPEIEILNDTTANIGKTIPSSTFIDITIIYIELIKKWKNALLTPPIVGKIDLKEKIKNIHTNLQNMIDDQNTTTTSDSK